MVWNLQLIHQGCFCELPWGQDEGSGLVRVKCYHTNQRILITGASLTTTAKPELVMLINKSHVFWPWNCPANGLNKRTTTNMEIARVKRVADNAERTIHSWTTQWQIAAIRSHYVCWHEFPADRRKKVHIKKMMIEESMWTGWKIMTKQTLSIGNTATGDINTFVCCFCFCKCHFVQLFLWTNLIYGIWSDINYTRRIRRKK